MKFCFNHFKDAPKNYTQGVYLDDNIFQSQVDSQRNMTCPAVNVLLSHMNGEKLLSDFTAEELKMLPLDYLLKNITAGELLNSWYKLPMEYKSNYFLQVKLPCFVHYNRPEWRTHLDGPPDSQEKCYLCNKIIMPHYV